jgi:hypothetical protein
VSSTYKINVTRELVERATQRDSRHCMIAEAIKEAHPHYTHILVDLATIRWSNPRTGNRYVCLTPVAAGNALVAFDQGEPIEPFSFSIQTMQVTPMAIPVKREDGTRAQRSVRGRKRFENGVIKGGTPLPTGHLGGSPSTAKDATSLVEAREREARAAEAAAASESQTAIAMGEEGNVKLSGSRYRQYGRRVLKA